MTESYRLTRVEELDQEHPGLEDCVREELKRGSKLASVSETVKEKFGVLIALSTLHSFWQRRFAPDAEQQRKAYQQTRARVDVLLEEMKGGDKDAQEIVRLIVQSQIFERSEELAGANPLELVKEDRRRAESAGRLEIERGKLALAKEQLEHEKKALEVKVEQLEGARDKVKAALESAGVDGPKDPAELRRKINEIYGIA